MTAAPELWRLGVRNAIHALALTGRPFTVADLRTYVGQEPDVPARWGAAIAAALRTGSIEMVGCQLNDRGRPVRMWRGTGKGAT